MLVLTSWLREFVPFTVSVEELAHDLTMSGLEVEGMESAYKGLDTAVVCRIIEIDPHPSASHLKICKLDTGSGDVQVVCGAPNLERGRLSVLALPGTELPDGTVVEATNIHGVPSSGMLCSEVELFLGEDAAGIMYIEEGPGVAAGNPVVKALGLDDWILEIGITPNRSDSLSILGVAREVSAIYGLPLAEKKYGEQSPVAGGRCMVPVTVQNPELCGRYAAAELDHVSIGPSPRWLARRLLACGIRPINNVVDATNYVLMELGQPLHAFDMDRLEGPAIVVRTAKPGEKVLTIDGRERELEPDMLVIADGRRPVAVAGVMGGGESEVREATTRVLLESAWFAPSQVRRTSKKLKLSSESSYRFERGVDPGNTLNALKRAVRLMAETAGARLLGMQDVCPRPHEPREVYVRPQRVNRMLGTGLTGDVVAEILEKVGVRLSKVSPDRIAGIAPSYRPDLVEEIDLIEEVARLHGYGEIPTKSPVAALATEIGDLSSPLARRVKDVLAGLGMTEVISYSFVSPDEIRALGFHETDKRNRAVRIKNPLTEDQSVLRTSIICSLLGAAARNQARRNLDLRLFETGTVFCAREAEQLPEEEQRVAAIWAGLRHPESWAWPREPADLFDLKGVLEDLLTSLGVFNYQLLLETPDDPYYLPGSSARIEGGDRIMGTFGQLSPGVLESYDVTGPVFAFDLSIEALDTVATDVRAFRRLPRYPAVERDVAVVVKDHLRARELLDFIEGRGIEAIDDVTIFDLYRGKPIRKGYKSIGLRLTYRATDHTLSDEEVSALHEPLVASLLQTFKAELRS